MKPLRYAKPGDIVEAPSAGLDDLTFRLVSTNEATGQSVVKASDGGVYRLEGSKTLPVNTKAKQVFKDRFGVDTTKKGSRPEVVDLPKGEELKPLNQDDDPVYDEELGRWVNVDRISDNRDRVQRGDWKKSLKSTPSVGEETLDSGFSLSDFAIATKEGKVADFTIADSKQHPIEDIPWNAQELERINAGRQTEPAAPPPEATDLDAIPWSADELERIAKAKRVQEQGTPSKLTLDDFAISYPEEQPLQTETTMAPSSDHALGRMPTDNAAPFRIPSPTQGRPEAQPPPQMGTNPSFVSMTPGSPQSKEFYDPDAGQEQGGETNNQGLGLGSPGGGTSTATRVTTQLGMPQEGLEALAANNQGVLNAGKRLIDAQIQLADAQQDARNKELETRKYFWEQEQKKSQQFMERYKQKLDDIDARMKSEMEKYINGEVDPNRFWKNKSTAGKITAALAMAFGAYGSALAKTPNYAMQIINEAIDQDIAAQQFSLDKQGKVVGMLRGLKSDVLAEREMGMQELAIQKEMGLQIVDLLIQKYANNVTGDAQKMATVEQMKLELAKIDRDNKNDLISKAYDVTQIETVTTPTATGDTLPLRKYLSAEQQRAVENDRNTDSRSVTMPDAFGNQILLGKSSNSATREKATDALTNWMAADELIEGLKEVRKAYTDVGEEGLFSALATWMGLTSTSAVARVLIDDLITLKGATSNLGVLNPTDVDRLSKGIGKPSEIKHVLDKLDQMQDNMRKKAMAIIRATNLTINPNFSMALHTDQSTTRWTREKKNQ